MSLLPKESIEESTIKLRNKMRIPLIGFDTSTLLLTSVPYEVTKTAVTTAIDAGYLLFYCDSYKKNEKAVGDALKEKLESKKIKREDIFIIAVVHWNAGDKEGYVEESTKESLENLGLDYVDLLLFHCPVIKEMMKIVYKKTWRGMEKCVKDNLTKAIGLSNFDKGKIKRLLKIAKIKPVLNVLECNVFVNRKKLQKFCKKKKIALMAINPFGPINQFVTVDLGRETPEKKELNRLTEIQYLATRYEKTNCQIALRYLIDRGIISVFNSTLETSIQANNQIFDFHLMKEEIKMLNKVDDGTYDPFKPLYNVYMEDYGYINFD